MIHDLKTSSGACLQTLEGHNISLYTPYNNDTVSQLPKTATFNTVLQVMLTIHSLGIMCI